jgi:hypothetical protein
VGNSEEDEPVLWAAFEQKAQEIAINMLNEGVAIAYGGRLRHRIH